jgi:glutamate dehydrogenase
MINRLGVVIPFELADEEAVSLAQLAAAYVTVDNIFDIQSLWEAIETAEVSEDGRLDLLTAAGVAVRRHMADLLRTTAGQDSPSHVVATLAQGVTKLDSVLPSLLKQEVKLASEAFRQRLGSTGASGKLIDRIVRLQELDGAIGNAALAQASGMDQLAASRAYVRLGEALGLDWAHGAVSRFSPADGWERLLIAGLARDFEQLRLDFLARKRADDPVAMVDHWLADHAANVAQFRTLIQRAQTVPPSAAMLAQIASQARVLLAR